jgi:hypothetical protein
MMRNERRVSRYVLAASGPASSCPPTRDHPRAVDLGRENPGHAAAQPFLITSPGQGENDVRFSLSLQGPHRTDVAVSGSGTASSSSLTSSSGKSVSSCSSSVPGARVGSTGSSFVYGEGMILSVMAPPCCDVTRRRSLLRSKRLFRRLDADSGTSSILSWIHSWRFRCTGFEPSGPGQVPIALMFAGRHR